MLAQTAWQKTPPIPLTIDVSRLSKKEYEKLKKIIMGKA